MDNIAAMEARYYESPEWMGEKEIEHDEELCEQMFDESVTVCQCAHRAQLQAAADAADSAYERFKEDRHNRD